MVLCQPAVDITRYLLGNFSHEGQLPHNASALLGDQTSILHTAAYIENLVQHSRNMGRLNLLIFSKCKPLDSENNVHPVMEKIFR